MSAAEAPQGKLNFHGETKTQMNKYRYVLEFENFKENIDKVQNNTAYGSPSTMTMLGVDGFLKNWNCEFYPRGLKNSNNMDLYFVIWREDIDHNIGALDIKLSILNNQMQKVGKSAVLKNIQRKNAYDSVVLCEYLICPIQLNAILDPAKKIIDNINNNTLRVSIECTVTTKVMDEKPRLVQSDVPKNIVQDAVAKYIDNDKFSDVILDVKGVELKAHKVILAAQSPVFLTMFDQEDKTVDSKINRVKIDDIEPDVVRQMLEFIYTGKDPSKIDDGAAAKLVVAAQKYQLERLSIICEGILAKSIAVDNALANFIFADRCKLKLFKTAIAEFIKMHRSILEREEFRNFERYHPQLAIEVYQEITLVKKRKIA